LNWLQILMQIIYVIVFAGALCVGGSWCAYLYRKKAQQLPENQRLALEQFAQLAVQSIEQTWRNKLTGETKKQRAIEAMMILYKDHPELKVPTERAIEIAIEAACLYLPKQDG
jgi:hypothetical protein